MKKAKAPSAEQIRAVRQQLPRGIVDGWTTILRAIVIEVASLTLTYAAGDITEEEYRDALRYRPGPNRAGRLAR
jgi:hypothetical protein